MYIKYLEYSFQTLIPAKNIIVRLTTVMLVPGCIIISDIIFFSILKWNKSFKYYLRNPNIQTVEAWQRSFIKSSASNAIKKNVTRKITIILVERNVFQTKVYGIKSLQIMWLFIKQRFEITI